MKLFPLPFAFALCLGPAQAQVNIHIDIGLPPAPRMVVVQPGIQVVEGIDEEVFFHGGWYWCRRPNGWYRSRTPRSHFDWVEGRRVPRGLMRMPEGHYRNWHREERREMRREEHREMKQERREDRHERRDERRDERRGEHRGEGGEHRDRR